MKADIQKLQAYQQMSDRIFTSLASGDRSDFIIQQLRDGNTVESISKGLGEQQIAKGATDIGDPLSIDGSAGSTQRGSM
jgi:hypothetical protein